MMSHRSGTVLTLALAVSLLVVTTIWMAMISAPVAAQQNPKPAAEDLRAGRNLSRPRSTARRTTREILKLFEGLRESDVCDGMDKVGLANVGLMSPQIHAAVEGHDTLQAPLHRHRRDGSLRPDEQAPCPAHGDRAPSTNGSAKRTAR